MGDSAKEEPAQQKEPKFLGKAGWLKKAPGRLLASYRDRYIHIEKTEVAVYENEGAESCIERFDLENYDKCHELKSPFKKRHRLVLIRSPRSGNKIQDVKFQAQSAEDKEAWIKAFGDGISRAKNKVFDEVKIDESCNLEHVTRTRPKGNRNRRPPTRIHMKEIADVSSDGILRLDLDLENAVMPNGTHHDAVDGTHTSKETTAFTPQDNSGGSAETLRVRNADNEAQPERHESPHKKVIKPPMPPLKEPKASLFSHDEPEKEAPEKKVPKPLTPPVLEAKPCASPGEDAKQETQSEQVPEICPEVRKVSDPPPTPPNKPSSNNSMSSLSESTQPRSNPHLPTPPPKEKKPSHQAVESEDLQSSDQKNKEQKAEECMKKTVVEIQEEVEAIAEPDQLHVTDDKPDSIATGDVSEEYFQETLSDINTETNNEPEIPAQPLRKSPTPPLICKTNIYKQENCATATHQLFFSASDTSTSSVKAENSAPESEVPSIIVSLNDSLTDSLDLSPLLCHSSGEKKQKSEEKSVDSGQHSDDDSECSGCEDTLSASMSALRGSNVGLDLLDKSEDGIQTAGVLVQKQASNKPQVKPKFFAYRCSESTSLLRPSAKTKSASSGDLLSSDVVCAEEKQPRRHGNETTGAPCDELLKLESEVAQEMENTGDLLSRVSDLQKGADAEGIPENLLTEAMDKLKKADHVLREVNKLKLKHRSHNRKSW